jgi:hypothetical protein
VIDLYQIHWPPDPDSAELEEGWSTLASLQRQGKARWIGVSNFNVQQLRRARPSLPHGFTEILFAYTSCFANNGQNFAGLKCKRSLLQTHHSLSDDGGQVWLGDSCIGIRSSIWWSEKHPFIVGHASDSFFSVWRPAHNLFDYDGGSELSSRHGSRSRAGATALRKMKAAELSDRVGVAALGILLRVFTR